MFHIQGFSLKNLESGLSKFLLTSLTLVRELSNSYDYFFKLSGLPGLFGKVSLINFNSPNFI